MQAVLRAVALATRSCPADQGGSQSPVNDPQASTQHIGLTCKQQLKRPGEGQNPLLIRDIWKHVVSQVCRSLYHSPYPAGSHTSESHIFGNYQYRKPESSHPTTSPATAFCRDCCLLWLVTRTRTDKLGLRRTSVACSLNPLLLREHLIQRPDQLR